MVKKMEEKDPFEGKLFVSPTEVAKLLSVTRQTVYNWINSGKLKSARFSKGCVRIPVLELKDFIKKASLHS
jgi:excisionase family DNA binding protein